MKICPHCNAEMHDEANFCTSCGTPYPDYSGHVPPIPGTGVGYQGPSYTAPFDHTAEFSAQDISENKVVCMLMYLLGLPGLIIAMLAKHTSPYVDFHVRQVMKFIVVQVLTALVTLLLCWTLIVPLVAGVFIIVLTVIRIICFFQICSGKAIEPAIIRSIGFLK